MDKSTLFEELQYLGFNKSSFIVRTILALFCFSFYYWSDYKGLNVGSGNLFFIIGISIIAISLILIYVKHFKTSIRNGSILLERLWTTRTVKIELSSIKSVTKEKYSRFLFNKSVFNLHSKGAIRFYTRGNDFAKLTDKDGLIYYIGSQRANELVQLIEKQLKTTNIN
jgi:hypothetical protein